MINKKQFIQYINAFPEEISIDVLIDSILFMEKVETGLKQSEERNVIRDEDLEKNLDKWLD